MTPQIIGSRKSASYRACIRYCRERSITCQERDPADAPLSPGELDSIASRCGGFRELLDEESAAYKKRGLQWMDFDPREELLQTPALLRGPIVRTDKGVAVDPDGKKLEELFS